MFDSCNIVIFSTPVSVILLVSFSSVSKNGIPPPPPPRYRNVAIYVFYTYLLGLFGAFDNVDLAILYIGLLLVHFTPFLLENQNNSPYIKILRAEKEGE